MYSKGVESEKIAENYLLKRGYTIHYRNKRYGRNEIDLVCEINGIIVFVEVKSLLSDRLKKPYESVNYKKQRNIIKVADHLIQNHFPNHECRFDVISMTGKSEELLIEHIKNAFIPEINNL